MAETLPMRLVEAFTSPLGMTVLVLALLGIAGTIAWAFWDKQRSGQSSSGATQAPLKPAAPPLLNNEIMRPAAMTNVSGASDGVLRNILIAIVAIVAVIIGAQFIVGGKAEKAGQNVAATTTPPAPTQTAYVPPRGESLVDCDEGPRWSSRDEDSEVFVGIEQEAIKSYIVCAERNSAQFDVIDFMAEEDGTFILNPVWHPVDLPILGTEQDLYYAKPQFALSRDEFDMVAGPGSRVSDYDLFVAIGLAGFDVDTGVAAAFAGIELERVGAVTTGHDIAVRPCTVRAAIDDIVTPVADDHVIVAKAIKRVVTVIAGDQICMLGSCDRLDAIVAVAFGMAARSDPG
ncbi:MAG: hypothetical protein AAGA69_05070, partial [Pseudomonadota bacterium]